MSPAKLTRFSLALSLLAALTACAGSAATPTTSADEAAAVHVILGAYTTPREAYGQLIPLFAEKWKAQTGQTVTFEESYQGSGAQSRAIVEGFEADVAALSLQADIDRIVDAGLITHAWRTVGPSQGMVSTSVVAFAVRPGNPENIQDWDDLIRDGIEVITPNPKTSGGARWNYLAAWGYAQENGLDPREFVGAIYRNVPVLDTAARGSTTTFVQRGLGDVLLAWENEAYLALAELGEDQFDIIVPSISVLAEPPVALVPGNITDDATRALATAYLEQLYSPEGQAIALRHYYRAWDTSAAAPEDVARFPEVNRLSIDYFGGWAVAQPEHFADGGIFDQIYQGQ